MPDPIIKYSYIGTPIISNVVLIAPQYNNEQQQRDAPFDDLDRVELNHVLVSVRQAKQIVKTQVEGLNGSIKEYISLGDYEITINGNIVNEEDSQASPKQRLNDLRRFLDYNDAIEISNKLLNSFDIRSVVVMDYVVNEQAGTTHVYPIRIRLISDTPEEIKFRQTQSGVAV